MIEQIVNNGKLNAIIIRHSFKDPGIHFLTPPEFSQQLAYMCHNTGKRIQPHVHNQVSRNVQFTQEVLFIKKGILRVDFYDKQQSCFDSRLLGSGDTILLAAGGHGFEVIENVEMIEVKQGPYAGDGDKTRFEPKGKESLSVKG